MPAAKAHSWTLRSRFRAGAFGWRSDLPIKRITEAVAEIKKAARKDKVLGAEGSVIFLEKVSGALEHVDRAAACSGQTCPFQPVAGDFEEPSEFAVMGCQNAWPLYPREQIVRRSFERAQCIGIDDDGRARSQRADGPPPR